MAADWQNGSSSFAVPLAKLQSHVLRFRVLATEQPIDATDLHRRIRKMLEDAEQFISRIPSDVVGVIFLDAIGKPVQPDLEALDKYQRHTGTPGGIWPSSPEISSAMLERYKKKNGNGGDPKP